MAIKTVDLATRLDHYYEQVRAVILSRQSPISGLLPASTAVNAHGDYTDAWVRDNVYSILAVWGLGLAYRKLDDDRGRTYELEHSVVKLMRGLLFSMMRQAEKVEKFKANQAPLDALHAKYDTDTGSTVVGDDEWGHLQLDATSIFLLMLAQMTASGLAIVFTTDEVNFIQNLVYYIGRTYRTPDYGIWERGNKINHGNPELNASSVGMAKAALEALNGLNLFGVHGSQASVIHVLPDEIARCRTTLESLLPRESSSKEVDAALLSVISFPAFAVEDVQLVDRTRTKIVTLLQGRYGCKRFLRDGHQTVLENSSRLHYEPWELKQFEHIESEWPLFFTYLALDGLFRDDRQQAQYYLDQLEQVVVKRDGLNLLPELYYVPEAAIEPEKANPSSQTRLPNENVPLVWAQSLYFLAQMLHEGLLAVGDIDPIGGHLRIGQKRKATVQIALLAEDEDLQSKLAANNITTQTLKQVEPIQVRHARELAAAYAQVGRNDKLDLTGRPMRRMRSLTTSRVFKICGETIVFLPSFLEPRRFYLTLDYHFLVSNIKSELAYTHRHWQDLGKPTMTLLLTKEMLELGREALINLVQEFQEGRCGDVPVQLGRLNQLALTAGTERIDSLHDFEFPPSSVVDTTLPNYHLVSHPEKNCPLSLSQEFKLEYETDIDSLVSSLHQSHNLYEQIELLSTLARLKGLDFDTRFTESQPIITVMDLLNEVYAKASKGDELGCPYWGIVRRSAGLLDKLDVGLSDAVTDILVRQKQIAVGRAYSEDSLIMQPLPYVEVLEKIRHFCREDIRDRVLTQEILIYLSVLIKSEPNLFQGLLTLKVGYLILLITANLAQELALTQDEAYEHLMQLSPFEIKTCLRQILMGYADLNQALFKQESLRVKLPDRGIDWVVLLDEQTEVEPANQDWWRKRQLDGSLNRVPKDFYPSVWQLLHHCKGLVIGDKLERRNRLDSELIIMEMTAGEKNFALQIEHLLNKIQAPEYRQVNVEAMMELATIAQRNPDLKIEESIVLDVLIGHAVRLAWLDKFPDFFDRYDEHKGSAWRSFYESSPYDCASYIAKAMRFLTQLGQTTPV
ncbi:glycosyl hydrolase family 15 [Phormidesmis priestleyi ULC007]|uniref:Glycosyl hydrolase family 15 n=1 Tax=Phormidesmis priestleyi ULC007 TaxID=1920490 RepID=A0A2T1DHH6_9CYAN|nr:glycoside hydrolase family 15 protein [Phormidesmis priestleyi]PSB19891.1 glycosyl hydrolase family 15 [Phormidesmis priestleyi ULC007]PZO49218.1 MAG: glycosyl hydrolase family 15 [Phormidesmis priestleyi]